ncbi:MAG: hypothetical protein ACOX0X_01800 [Candidatus Dojkabacteria bacterium]|jgi:hypothetical protein
MENTNASSVQNTHTESPTPKKESNKTLFFVLGVIFSILLLAAILGVWAYKQYAVDIFKKEGVSTIEIDEEQPQENKAKVKEISFKGKTFTATMPEGWNIKEYYDGEGSETLAEGVKYTGLTGLKIFNGETSVFSLRAISGIGFVGCPSYIKFSDFNPEHLQKSQSAADQLEDEIKITDYSNSKYVELKWLGKRLRRVGVMYYLDETDGNEYFEVSCMPGVISIEGVSFTQDSTDVGEAYFFGSTSDATEGDLVVVDEILKSMKLK